MVSYRRLAMRVLGHVPVLFGKKKASSPPRIAAQRIAALALACAMMTGMALPAFAATYDIVSGSIDIHATESGQLISQWFMNGEQKEYVSDSDGDIKDRPDNNITITGTSTGNTVTIDADKDQTAHVTLENVEINASSTDQAAVEVTGSGDTNIELNGDNTLTGDSYHAGLEHNKTDDSGTLTIQDEKNDDGSAKGSASDTTGSLTATGGYHSAGIGGSDEHDGQVTITGGEITATGGNGGAGIGGGAGDTDAVGGDGDVTISGGTITATGGSLGAGIWRRCLRQWYCHSYRRRYYRKGYGPLWCRYWWRLWRETETIWHPHWRKWHCHHQRRHHHRSLWWLYGCWHRQRLSGSGHSDH